MNTSYLMAKLVNPLYLILNSLKNFCSITAKWAENRTRLNATGAWAVLSLMN